VKTRVAKQALEDTNLARGIFGLTPRHPKSMALREDVGAQEWDDLNTSCPIWPADEIYNVIIQPPSQGS
jgi:hypothetical protein